MNIIKQSLIFFMLFLSCHMYVIRAGGQGNNQPPQPAAAKEGAYTKYFQYYLESGAGMPVGSDLVSDAVMAIVFNSGSDTTRRSAGTGFIIYSSLDSNKVCLCTAGHIVSGYTPGQKINMDVFMKYRGRPRDSSGAMYKGEPLHKYGKTQTSFKSTVGAELIAVGSPALDTGDWAVLKLPIDQLPVKGFAMLGVNFHDTAKTPSVRGENNYYSVGHPLMMPQRITDSNSYSNYIIPSSPHFFLYSNPNRTQPGGTGPGFSGSPVVNKSLSNPAVIGIVDGSFSNDVIELADVVRYDSLHFTYPHDFTYFKDGARCTKMADKGLMAAIKNKCWNKIDSSTIEAESLYQKSVRIDNTQSVSEFEQNRSITSQTGVQAAADQSYGASNVNSMLLKAAQLTVNCLVTNPPGKNFMYCLAKEAVLEAGFSYAASVNKEMMINTVVTESITASKIPLSEENDATTEGYSVYVREIPTKVDSFNVYPNPTHDGIFHISLPATLPSNCYVTIYNSAGSQVRRYDNIAPHSDYTIDLSGLVKGSYIVNIYTGKTGKPIFTKVVIYR